jgi:hypothetical protein
MSAFFMLTFIAVLLLVLWLSCRTTNNNIYPTMFVGFAYAYHYYASIIIPNPTHYMSLYQEPMSLAMYVCVVSCIRWYLAVHMANIIMSLK